MAGGQTEWRKGPNHWIAQMDSGYSATGAIGKVRWNMIVGHWMKQMKGNDLVCRSQQEI